MASAVMGSVGASLGGMAAGTFGWSAATWGQIGWTAGVLAANYLFAPDGPHIENTGPRLDDLKVTSSAYGVDIPKVYGSYRISGNIIWALPLHETKHEERQESGKGGGGSSTTSTWYTYKGTWAIALCEGPITGIKKIWFGSVLVYNDGDYAGGLKRSNTDIYLGTDSQEINWRIQSDSKASDTPAYRNVVYMVFEDIELEDYGNKLPNITAEVIKSGTNEIVREADIQLRRYYDNRDISGSLFYGIHDGYIYYSIDNYVFTSSQSGFIIYKQSLHGGYVETFEVSNTNVCENGSCTMSDTSLYISNHCSGMIPGQMLVKGSDWPYNTDDRWYDFMGGTTTCCPESYSLDKKYVYTFDYNALHSEYAWYKDSIVYNMAHKKLYNLKTRNYVSVSHTFGSNDGLTHLSVYNNEIYIITILETQIEVTIFDFDLNVLDHKIALRDFYHQYAGCCVVESDGYHIARGSGGHYYYHLDFELNTLQETYFNAVGSWGGGENWIKDGRLYNHYTDTNHITDKLEENYLQVWRVGGLSSSTINLSSVIEDVLQDCGYSIADYDLSEGDSTQVEGYVISKNMTGRSAIEPLLSTYDFTLIENNHKIYLKKQQSSSVLNIPEEDLGANTDSKIEYNVSQELDLFKKIDVRYANKNSDYQTSVQSCRRIDPNATEERIVELPLALTDSQAKKIAETQLYRNWLQRQSYSFQLPYNYKDLTTGDVITINFDGYEKDVRLTKITTTEDYIVQCNAISENYGVYDSDAEGQSTDGNESVLLEPIGDTSFKILDIPSLDNSVNSTEGMYIACTGYTNSWSGAMFYSKTSEVDDLTSITALIGSTPIGESINTLADGPTHVWDRSGNITVYSSIALVQFSTTEASVLNGNNYILLGEEILQFVTAVENDNGSYTLTTLLRGRRGTENKTSTHVIHERFVYLKSSTMGFISKSINSNDYYTAIGFGADTNEDSIVQVQNTGNNLKPFAPAYARSKKEDNDDFSVSWMKKSRYVSGYLKTLPIIDTPESYNVDVVDDINGEVINSYIVSSQNFTYTSAMQVADGLSPGLKVGFYISQISPIYGKGEEVYSEFGELSLESYMIHYWKMDSEVNLQQDEVAGLSFNSGNCTEGDIAHVNDGGKSIRVSYFGSQNYVYTDITTVGSIAHYNKYAFSCFIDSAAQFGSGIYYRSGELEICMDNKYLSVFLFDPSGNVIRNEKVTGISMYNVLDPGHLVVNINGVTSEDEFDIYFNSVLVEESDKTIVKDATKTFTDTPINTRIYIGLKTNQWSGNMNMRFDDYRLFSRPLTQEQVTELWDMRNF
ncbi:MAG: hypothetical protein GY707_05225 [Desulfobacteraceae bacterium]|nr:hypothetical protein [Desulfobacteraceae bacterium]